MSPNGNLKQTFEATISTFNNAHNDNPQDYHNFLQYLYPNINLVIQKVDDPGAFAVGTNTDIIKYLNNDEADPADPKFPQLKKHTPSYHPKEHKRKNGEEVGDVTGQAIYYDRFTDPDSASIPVEYCLRYKKYNSIWLLVTALIAPI